MQAEERIKAPFGEIYDQAVKTYEQMLKNSLKLQQEANRWWSAAAANPSSPDMQRRVRAFTEDLLPQSQKNLELWLKAVGDSTTSAIELTKQASTLAQSSTVHEAQHKALALCQESMKAICESTQTMTQVNAKALEVWFDFARKAGDSLQSATRA